MKTYKLEQFEGPLDLLLQMIKSEELDITQLSLATLADQFILHIEANPEISGEELADFLVVASQLLLLKSKFLLPTVDFEDEISPESLETQLKLYRKFVDAAQKVGLLYENSDRRFVKKTSNLKAVADFRPPHGLEANDLVQAMEQVLKRLQPIVILPESVMEKTITMHEKIREIQSLIKNAKGLPFSQLLRQSTTKTEQIVSFLALLELVKQEEVTVRQSNSFDDILIDKAL